MGDGFRCFLFAFGTSAKWEPLLCGWCRGCWVWVKYDGKPPAEIVEATAGKLGATLPQCQGHLTPDARKRGWEKSAAKRKEAALKAYADFAPRMLAMWKDDRLSLRAIADTLNAEDTAAGDGGEDKAAGGDEAAPKPAWSAMKVKRSCSIE